METKISIPQLEEIVGQFKMRVIPSVFDKRDKIFQKLQIMQQENCLFSRSLYLLVYNLFIDENTKLITHEDFTVDILTTDYEKITNESCLSSFESQVFLNTIKQLNNSTRLFASSLITAINENKSFQYNLFSFSTFPAIFGYFSSSELYAQASLLLLDLLALGAADDLLHPMIFSFFLSMFPFTDALWNNFYIRLRDRPSIKEDDIMESLSHAISECSPLIPAPSYLVMRELLLNRSSLLKDIIVKSYLPITFNLWYSYSNYAMSFAFGTEVLSFLDKNASNQRGMMLSSLFVIDTCRIDVIPSFTTQCRFSSEVLFFSNIDMKLFVEAFTPISSQIQLFETLQEASTKCDEYPPFMPFPISFFMNSAKPKIFNESILNYPKVKIKKEGEILAEGELFYISDNDEISKDYLLIEEPEPEPIYEAAIQELRQSNRIKNSSLFQSEKFQLFLLKKELFEFVEMAETQEYFVNLKIQFDIAQEYQKSILNYRRYSFSAYAARYIKDSNPNLEQSKDGSGIEAKAFEILDNCNEKRLIIPTFVEIVNFWQFSDFFASDKMHSSFLKITRSFIESNWRMAGDLSRNRFLLNLVPYLSRRKKLKIGHYFYLLDQLLKDVRRIAAYYYKKPNIEDEMQVLLQAVIYSSNTETVLDIFLFYEKIAFRCPNFLSNLSLEQSKNWNLFFQIIWKTLEKDKNLFKQIMDMNLSLCSDTKKKK